MPIAETTSTKRACSALVHTTRGRLVWPSPSSLTLARFAEPPSAAAHTGFRAQSSGEDFKTELTLVDDYGTRVKKRSQDRINTLAPTFAKHMEVIN